MIRNLTAHQIRYRPPHVDNNGAVPVEEDILFPSEGHASLHPFVERTEIDGVIVLSTRSESLDNIPAGQAGTYYIVDTDVFDIFTQSFGGTADLMCLPRDPKEIIRDISGRIFAVRSFKR